MRPLLLLIAVLAGCGREEARQAPLPSQVYVWQRSWKPEVSETVRSTRWDAMHVLAAELGMRNGKPEATVIAPDCQVLAESGMRVGAVLRVHASVGKGGWNDGLTQELQRLCTDTVARFKTEGVRLTELQLDYDCAESRLPEYARLLGALQAEVPLCITALPAWLRQDAARDLLKRSPGYVLQVHSLHLPRQGGVIGLMDMKETREAVRRAVAIGVPFRVALPTYSCIVEFDDGGQIRDIHGEDLPAGFAIGARHYAVLDSDAYALSALMADWRAHAPGLMQSVIWYRLPVSSDRLNWPPGLLERVARGDTLRRGWEASARLTPEGHHEIVLLQKGEAPDDLPREVQVSWQGAAAEASDGLRGYVVQQQAPGHLTLRLAHPSYFARMRSGQQIIAGWLRLPEAAKGEPTVRMIR